MSRQQIGGAIGFVVGGYLGAGGYGFNVQAASYGYVIGPALGTLESFPGPSRAATKRRNGKATAQNSKRAAR